MRKYFKNRFQSRLESIQILHIFNSKQTLANQRKMYTWKTTLWLTREIRQLHARDYHLKQHECTNSEVHSNQYKRLRNTINNKIRSAKANHVRAVF